MSDRIVEQVVELYRVLERVVEQIIDVQNRQVMSRSKKYITQQVEDTQYRHSAVGEDFKSGSRSDSLNKLLTYRSSQNSQENDAEKEFNRPSERSSKWPSMSSSERRWRASKIIKIAVQREESIQGSSDSASLVHLGGEETRELHNEGVEKETKSRQRSNSWPNTPRDR